MSDTGNAVFMRSRSLIINKQRNRMPVIAPSILSADFANLERDIRMIENAGCDWIHVDVMDGHFVPNLTIGPPVIRRLRKITSLPLDVHLMITDPDKFTGLYREAGADYITVHQEACVHLQRTLQSIRQSGAKAGVALNPATPPETLSYVLGDLDLILVMTVNPGFGGQTFLPSAAEKIPVLKKMTAGRSVLIEVDGGIQADTGNRVVQAGADVLVAGSFVFHSPDPQEAVRSLKQIVRTNTIA